MSSVPNIVVHALADTYPIDTARVERLAADMRVNGFRAEFPVVFAFTGELLDGRHRMLAALAAGVPHKSRKLLASDDAAAFVAAANERRPFTPDQELMRRARFGLERAEHQRPDHFAQAQSLYRTHPQLAERVWADPVYTLRRALNQVARESGKQVQTTRRYGGKLGQATAGPVAHSPEGWDYAPAVPPPAPAPVAPRELVELSRARASAAESKSRVDALVAELARLQLRDALFDELTGAPPPPRLAVERASGLREGVIVAGLSDVHFEELVRPDATPTGNAYCLEIAAFRVERFFRGLLWFLRAQQEAFKIRGLVLWLGGDMATGHLHDENLETSQLGPGPAFQACFAAVEAGIQMLLDSGLLEWIDVPCSVGNHGRTTDRMRAATAADHSWEWVGYQTMAARFRAQGETRARFITDRSTHQYHEIFGFRLHFHHGHEVKYGGGVGGITIPINKAVAQWDRVRRSDVHHFGHFHQLTDGGNFVVNGSCIGFNAYAMSIKASPEPPQQFAYVLDARRGKSVRVPIWVGKPEAESRMWAERKAV